MRVITDELPSGEFTTEATVKVWVGDERHVSPPRATVRSTPSTRRCGRRSTAPTRSSTGSTSPTSRCASSTAQATGAVTRVLLDATDGERDWTTIGVSANIIEASWRALEESIVYGLLHAPAQP